MTAEAAPPRRLWLFWGFIVLMLALSGLFVGLGWWQVNRLAEKEALIALVEERMRQPPQALPPVGEWVGFDAAVFDYRPVTLTGRYISEQSVLVFTSLVDQQGQYSGPGYWVMTPLRLTDGGVIWINRGFVPQQLSATFLNGGSTPRGEVTLTGIARAPEEASGFTPGPDAARRIEWVRDPARLAALADPSLQPVAPIYVDLPAGDTGALPQGGETRVSFPNNHFGYALTWFGFAALTPVLLIFWILRQRKPRSLQ
jgi:surfeit locus 1 family protein